MADLLGIYGQFVGRPPSVDPDTGEIAQLPGSLSPEAKRARRYQRARSIGRLLGHRGLSACHRSRVSKLCGVTVNAKHGAVRSGFYLGLQSCGKVWLCPHCQPRIASRRGREVQQAVDAWILQGGAVLLVTFTLAHGLPDRLVDTLAALKDAGRRLAQHRALKALGPSIGLHGRIVSTEITHGSNGWHPHLHQLWFVRPGLDLAVLQSALAPAWRASLQRSGFSASDAHGVRVDGGDRAARYVSKMGEADSSPWTLANELTQTGAKLGRGGSRSVWQILDDYRDRTIPRVDRKRCAALLLEYAAATKGTKALKWSPGLKDRFGIGDTTDEDLACEEADADTYEIAEIGPDDWPAVVRHQVQAHLLTVAEDHGSAGVARVVAGLRAITERHPAGADGCGSETGAPCAPVTASAAVSDSPPACSLGAQGRVFPDPLVSVIP
jgi:hypothetical protein